MSRDIVATGLVLACLAVVLVVRPELADRAGFSSLLAAAGNGYYIAAGLAGLAIFYALFIGNTWWLSGTVVQTDLPPVETFPTGAVPGAEFDEALRELAGERGRAVRPVDHRELIRERLRMDAVRTVARVQNRSLEDAGTRVETGEWTDNRYASAFVGGEQAPGPRWYQLLADRIRRRNPYSRRARQTVAALTELEEAES